MANAMNASNTTTLEIIFTLESTRANDNFLFSLLCLYSRTLSCKFVNFWIESWIKTKLSFSCRSANITRKFHSLFSLISLARLVVIWKSEFPFFAFRYWYEKTCNGSKKRDFLLVEVHLNFIYCVKLRSQCAGDYFRWQESVLITMTFTDSFQLSLKSHHAFYSLEGCCWSCWFTEIQFV